MKIGGKRIRLNPEPVDFAGVSRFVLIIPYGQMVESVGEALPVGQIGLTEAGIVRREDVIVLLQHRDQVAEHVAG